MEGSKKKIIRVTTVPQSLQSLLKGQLRFMSSYYDMVAVSSYGNCFEDMVREQGVRGIKLNMTRKITPFKDLYSLFQLIKLFKQEKPFIVHTHTPKAGTLGMIAAWITRVPHRIHTVAGLPLLVAKGPKRVLLNFVERVTYGCATKVLPNSFALKDIIIENKLGFPQKIGVIGNGSSNGIDTRFFSAGAVDKTKEELRTEFNIPQSSFVFIFVGRMVRDKGINELVAAFSQLYSKNKNTRLLLVGSYEKELDPLLPETIDAIDNHPGIIAVGFQKDVRPFFKLADALAFPSYREGFPNVVMQAGAMGLPAIVTDINGCNEIILEGKNGVIIPSQNTSALFAAMKDFLLVKEATQKMAKQSRSLITSRYEQKEVWKAILEMYQSLE